MPKITEMYAFVSYDDNPREEGVMAFLDQDSQAWMPMVGADMARVQSLKVMADLITKKAGKQYKILRFKLDGEVKP